MGHWILEATKFGVYITLPLTSFIIFNSPSFYTPVLYEWRKKMKPFLKNDEIVLKRQKEISQNLMELKLNST
ncbi:hypothetical protein BLOT_000097 [Blomia tropicalis]|nr:hypothetical protein BLOT_000097 [Blomia tropicalis]